MQAPYIPAQDGAFDIWLQNFSTLLTAAPATYGLVAADATAVATEYTNWHAAYLTATDPGTRTSPTIADKIAARVSAEAVVRPYAVSISLNDGVTDMDKLNIGVNLSNPAPSPIPAPATSPALILVNATPLAHRLQYRDSAQPTSKKKPFGVVGIEIWRAVGVLPAISPGQCQFYELWTKSPNTTSFDSVDVMKIATYFARWATRSGPAGRAQTGPWSAPLSVVII